MADKIRNMIVFHVSNNWDRFKCCTQMISGDSYDTVDKPNTYGSICEIMEAAELFSYHFQVYKDGRLIAFIGKAKQKVKRLRFTGNYNISHFYMYIQVSESTVGDNTNISDDNIKQNEENVLVSDKVKANQTEYIIECPDIDGGYGFNQSKLYIEKIIQYFHMQKLSLTNAKGLFLKILRS